MCFNMNIGIKQEEIKEIAALLDSGMRCFYHIPTGQLEYYPDDSYSYVDLDDEVWPNVIQKVESDSEKFIQFEKLEGSGSF